MYENIGQRMRELRESVHLSQTAIATMAQSTQATIAKTELGKIVPSLKLLLWYANYFDTSLDYICCRTDKPQGELYEFRPRVDIDSQEMKRFVTMCFDPSSPMHERLKEALFAMVGETKE